MRPYSRAEIIGLDVKLINGIRVGNDISGVAHAGHVKAAIEVIGNLPDHIVSRPVDNHMLHREADGVLVHDVLHSRRQVQQIVNIAAYEGQIFDLSVIHGPAQHGILRIDQGNLGGDLNNGSLCTGLKREVQGCLLGHG